MTKRAKQQSMVQVRALVPLWGHNEVVAVGTVYEQPVAAAERMAASGMVEMLGDASAPAVSMTEPETGETKAEAG